MNNICIDTETYYSEDCTVKTLGNYNYVRHPDWDCYMVSIAGDNDLRYVGPPEEAPWDKIFTKDSRLISHNTGFDKAVIERLHEQGIIPKPEYAVWEDTADLAAFLGVPRNLKGASKALLGVEMSKDVRDNMKAKRYQELPEEKQKEVLDYALGDAVNTLAIWNGFESQWPEEERWLSRHTRSMGEAGLPLDREALEEGITELEGRIDRALACVPWYKDTGKVLSRSLLEEECAKHGLIVPKSLAKDDEDCIAWENQWGDTYPFIGAIRDFRRCNMLYEKLVAMENRLKPDGCSLLSLKYFGGHTGRWSGDGGVNYQNLPRGDLFGVNLRKLIKAPPGKTFVIVDLSQIEARVTLWFAKDKTTLDMVAKGVDLYEAHARATMGYNDPMILKDYDKKNGTAHRQMAKVRVLGLGFGCGAEKFVQVARIMGGVNLSLEESQEVVTSYRQTNRPIVSLWRTLENHVGIHANTGTAATFQLPSGRDMHYREVKRVGKTLSALVCQGGTFFRKSLWGGTLAENCLAGDSEVLSDKRGWIRLDSVTLDDRLWDGVDFVSHEGLLDKGVQKTIPVHGVRATEDHLFLTNAGWVPAERACITSICEVASLDEEIQQNVRAVKTSGDTDRTPDCHKTSGKPYPKNPVGSAVPLRADDDESRNRTDEVRARHSSPSSRLRGSVPVMEGSYCEGSLHSWDESSPGVLCMEVDDRPVPPSDASGMEKLRGEGHHGLQAVGGVLRGILEEHGSDVAPRTSPRPDRQRIRLLSAKLPLGIPERELEKQEIESASGRMAEQLPGRHGRRESVAEHGVLEDSQRMDVGEDVVFDVLNCGPRHRFAVRSPGGGVPLIAHNCVQAASRDILAYYIRKLADRGFDVRLHVHDEVVLLCDEADAQDVLKETITIMSTPPEWIPDLPVAAEGEISNIYKK